LQVVEDRRQVSHVWQTLRSPPCSIKSKNIPNKLGF
jgi:hypothetical protein